MYIACRDRMVITSVEYIFSVLCLASGVIWFFVEKTKNTKVSENCCHFYARYEYEMTRHWLEDYRYMCIVT